MARMSRKDLILHMTYRDLILNLVVTQAFFLLLGFVLSILLFDSFNVWTDILHFTPSMILLWGVIPGVAVVCLDWVLMKFLPEGAYDDGGLNKKLFGEASLAHVFFIALFVAVCEELLFRGVLQTAFGIYIASTIFALIHFRYLKKPALFLSVVLLSFLLGYSYHITENLLVPITMHFTIDFFLGLILRKEGLKEKGTPNAK